MQTGNIEMNLFGMVLAHNQFQMLEPTYNNAADTYRLI